MATESLVGALVGCVLFAGGCGQTTQTTPNVTCVNGERLANGECRCGPGLIDCEAAESVVYCCLGYTPMDAGTDGAFSPDFASPQFDLWQPDLMLARSCLNGAGQPLIDQFDFTVLSTRWRPMLPFRRYKNAPLAPFCAAHVESQCCAELTACAGTPECLSIARCIEQCAARGAEAPSGSFDRCAKSCSRAAVDSYGESSAALKALYDCVEGNTTDPYYCAVDQLYNELDTPKLCNRFRVSSFEFEACAEALPDVCDGAAACWADPVCKPYAECVARCKFQDATCLNLCRNQYQPPNYPPVIDHFLNAFLTCSNRSCVETISGGGVPCTDVAECCPGAECVGGRCTISCAGRVLDDFTEACGDLTGCGVVQRSSCYCGAFNACGSCPSNGTCPGGAACGLDPCGQPCGGCGTGRCDLTTGTCIPCTPNCSGKNCGPDGCGGSCAVAPCPSGQACVGGVCKLSCVPNCTGKSCGPNGCGGSCGSCASGSSCASGACVASGPTGANACLQMTIKQVSGPGLFCSPEWQGYFKNICSRRIDCTICPEPNNTDTDTSRCMGLDLLAGEKKGGEWWGYWWCNNWSDFWIRYSCQFK